MVLKHQKVSVHILEPGLHATELVELDGIIKGIHRIFESSSKEIQEYYGKKCLDDFIWGINCMRFADKHLYRVINAHVHAITARYPKRRYAVGIDANTFFLIVRQLPELIGDVLLSTGITAPVALRKKKEA